MPTKGKTWKRTPPRPYSGDETCFYACGNPARFQQKNGRLLCAKTVRGCPEHEKQRATLFLKRTGYQSLMHNPVYQKRIQKQNLKKYGFKTPFESPDILERIRKSCLAKYGVDNPFKSAIGQAEAQQKVLEKFGVKNVFFLPEIQTKKQQTLQANYGVTNPLKNQEILERVQATNRIRYGANSPMQNRLVARKSFVSGMRKKHFLLPSGKEITLMGYEHFALDDLLFSGISEHDIDFELKHFPVFHYTNENGRKSIYTPDFFIPRLNWVIEVKSTYTYRLERNRNLVKLAAVKAAGYKMNLIIVLSRHPKLRLLRELHHRF
jgi:hypothetical protein